MNTKNYEFKQIANNVFKELIQSKVKTAADLARFKRKVAKKYRISCPSNMELLKEYHKLIKNSKIKQQKLIENLLKTRPIRSLSGIVNVSVLTKPFPCPGKCLYCPTEKGMPKSYVADEPAAQRAKNLNFDPFLQIQKRIEMLEEEGHPTDKIELRIIGGTWSYYPPKYQEWFIARCFEACNENSKFQITNYKKNQGSKFQISKLLWEQKRNETAKHRIVGLSIETRPDFINEEEIKRLRMLGVTMVELGVQSIYDNVLKKNLRGHNVSQTIIATKFLKDAGFKVLYQIMPNLYGSDLKSDKKMFKELFSNPDFRPDYLKIYPCVVMKEAPLYKIWQKGKHKPYTEKQLIELLKYVKKKIIPYYCRIQRITRDIPAKFIIGAPPQIANLRQFLTQKAKKENWCCKCIRCREVREDYRPNEKLYLFRQDYEASNGKEIFLSYESKNRERLYSLLRLRIPSSLCSNKQKTTQNETIVFGCLKNAAIIREIHTYGQLHPLNYRDRISVRSPQHKGLGKKMIKEAERITKKEFGIKKIAIISGVGVRGYYQKLSYKLKNTYMVKKL